MHCPVARRTFLSGVEVFCLPDSRSLTPLAPKRSLKQAVIELGGRIVSTANHDWPSEAIGDAAYPTTRLTCWRITWNGWRRGVIPLRDDRRLEEEKAFLSHQSSRQKPARQKRSHIMRAITIWRVAGLWVCLFGNLVPIGLPMVHATRPKIVLSRDRGHRPLAPRGIASSRRNRRTLKGSDLRSRLAH